MVVGGRAVEVDLEEEGPCCSSVVEGAGAARSMRAEAEGVVVLRHPEEEVPVET